MARQVLVEEQKTRGTRVRVASSPVSLGSDCQGLGSDKRLPVMIDLSLNQRIADKLREAADLLEQQAANPFRVGAYRHAADTVVGLQRDLRQLVDAEGLKGLTKLPTIGHGIAAAIHELITTGRWSQLERLRGTLDPAHLFQTIPGVSAKRARRLRDTLNVDTLEALETAAHQGKLEAVKGIGPRRAAILRASLASMLGRPRSRNATIREGPAVDLLLDVDEEYRQKAQAGKLPTIAPKRLNPHGTPWLPVLHTRRGKWHFAALYSNSPRAHELGRTEDWVVIYSYDEHHRETQQTVVTENRGTLVGKRVVRGREPECLALYARQEAPEEIVDRGSTGFLPFDL
jgi:DNA polymerase (family X)